MSKIKVETQFSRLENPSRLNPIGGTGSMDFRTIGFDFLETDLFTDEHVSGYAPRINGMYGYDLEGFISNMWNKNFQSVKNYDLPEALGTQKWKSIFGGGDNKSENSKWNWPHHDISFGRDYRSLHTDAKYKSIRPGDYKNYIPLAYGGEEKYYSFSLYDVNLRDLFRNLAFYKIDDESFSLKAFEKYVNRTSELPYASQTYDYFSVRPNPVTSEYVNEYAVIGTISSYVKFDYNNLLVRVDPIGSYFGIQDGGVGIKNTVTNEWIYRPIGYSTTQILKLNLSSGMFDTDFKFTRSNGDVLVGIPTSNFKIHVLSDSIFLEFRGLPSLEFADPLAEGTPITFTTTGSDIYKFDLNGVLDETFFGVDGYAQLNGSYKSTPLNIIESEKGGINYFYFVFGSMFNQFANITSDNGPLMIRSKADGSEHTVMLDMSHEINTQFFGSRTLYSIRDAKQDRDGNIVMIAELNHSGNWNVTSLGSSQGIGGESIKFLYKFRTLTDDIDMSFGFNDLSIEGDYSLVDFKYIFINNMFPWGGQSSSMGIYMSENSNNFYIYGDTAMRGFGINPFSIDINEQKLYRYGIGGLIRLNYTGELDEDFCQLGRTLAAYDPYKAGADQSIFGGFGYRDYESNGIIGIQEAVDGNLFICIGSYFSKWNDDYYMTQDAQYVDNLSDEYYGNGCYYREGTWIKLNSDGSRDKSFKYEILDEYAPVTSRFNGGNDLINDTSFIYTPNGGFLMLCPTGSPYVGIRGWTDETYIPGTYINSYNEFYKTFRSTPYADAKCYSGITMNFTGKNPSFNDPYNWSQYSMSKTLGYFGRDILERQNVNKYPQFDNSPSNVVGLAEFIIGSGNLITYQVPNLYLRKFNSSFSIVNTTIEQSEYDMSDYIYYRNVWAKKNDLSKYVMGKDYDATNLQKIKDAFMDLYTDPDLYPDCVDYKLDDTDPMLITNLYPDWKENNIVPAFDGMSWLAWGYQPKQYHNPWVGFDSGKTTLTEYYGQNINILSPWNDGYVNQALDAPDRFDELSTKYPGNPGDFIRAYGDWMEWDSHVNKWKYSSLIEDNIMWPISEMVNTKFSEFENLQRSNIPFLLSSYYIPKAALNNHIQNEI